MARRTEVKLSAEQETELVAVRDRHATPYMRERAAAVLKVASGGSVRQVALYRLLRVHKPETVSGWIERYLAAGLEGWAIRPGRGRKPGFSPSERAKHVARTDPLSVPDAA